MTNRMRATLAAFLATGALATFPATAVAHGDSRDRHDRDRQHDRDDRHDDRDDHGDDDYGLLDLLDDLL
jgi:hypothetical protein